MARWARGEDEVEELLHTQRLQQVRPNPAMSEELLQRATLTSSSARAVVAEDPDSAFVLAYDAARHALTALLAQQGLRPTAKGGHYALERAVRAQFGADFERFGALRRRRHELEYPVTPGGDASHAEAVEAIEVVEEIVEAAQLLLPELDSF